MQQTGCSECAWQRKYKEKSCGHSKHPPFVVKSEHPALGIGLDVSGNNHPKRSHRN